nr:ERF family protein [Alteraurantiacibacter buctensis]
MARAFGEIEAATKDANNPHFRSKYADLTSVIAAVKPALVKNGLFFTQHPEPVQGGVQIETMLHHAGGEHLSLGSLFVPANKNDAQAFGSALTYARRYALVTAFGVPVEDDDGNAATKNPPAASEAAPAKQPAHSALKVAVRNLVHELEGCGDWDTYVAFRETDDFKKVVAAVQQKLPQWWDGGPDMPEEFVPLRRRIELTEANLAEGKAQLLNA